MSKKKHSLFQDFFASAGADDRYFGMIYPGQLQHPKFLALSPGAKYLYVTCRAQARSKAGKAVLFKHREEFGRQYPESAFCFPSSHLEKYGIGRANASRWFRELEAAGFIRILESNRHQRHCNVYAFSADWKN